MGYVIPEDIQKMVTQWGPAALFLTTYLTNGLIGTDHRCTCTRYVNGVDAQGNNPSDGPGGRTSRVGLTSPLHTSTLGEPPSQRRSDQDPEIRRTMGMRNLVLLLICVDPLSVLCAVAGGKKAKTPVTKRTPRAREANITAALPTAAPQRNTSRDYDTCTGYYDVSGQFDKEFACNNTVHRYCCGSCFLRFCCQEKGKRIEQNACKNYVTPDWVKTPDPSPVPTGQPFDPSMDQTNTAVYITGGIIAFILVVGVSAKVAYDKATEPPQEMNIHRALADILRQQGPIPISQYDCENFAAMNGSPKDNTPQRTSSKNHYTPVHQSKSNHGPHYGKESVRSSGGHDLHTFISSGFVTLGRGQPKGKVQSSI
ncbi:hypothetical protein DPEC_G00331120 [Dallia pectoralis]|uniref:Uncharacterized protein n=1 Tax=Dallia pectoralis TaxID=75939 RepID=A0ACC2F990_DALPE|nr:hypothetical protein DPEC_G00331120 [Dallia pectoralis]